MVTRPIGERKFLLIRIETSVCVLIDSVTIILLPFFQFILGTRLGYGQLEELMHKRRDSFPRKVTDNKSIVFLDVAQTLIYFSLKQTRNDITFT
jgi:hypothetical protein